MKTLAFALLAALTMATYAQAPEENPAVSDFPSPVDPLDAEPGAPAAEPVPQAPITVIDEAPGTEVVGDQESPIGLYIMPWRESSAEEGLNRPARLLQEALLPIDRDVFKRQVEYYETLSAHRARQENTKP